MIAPTYEWQRFAYTAQKVKDADFTKIARRLDWSWWLRLLLERGFRTKSLKNFRKSLHVEGLAVTYLLLMDKAVEVVDQGY